MSDTFQLELITGENIELTFAGPSFFNLTLPDTQPINLELIDGSPITLTLPAPEQFNLALEPSAQIAMTINLSAAGVAGPVGPPGPRGSLFLGGYPSLANLPVPDGINVKVGDFALVQSESAIYELE